MQPYVVRDGDHLSVIAHKLGFDADTVWNDPKNADLKKLRGSPNILCAGDVVYVPDPKPKDWSTLTIGTLNPFVSPVPTVQLSLGFSQNGKALINAKCIIHGLAEPNQFSTDAAGRLSVSIPVTLQTVSVEFPDIPMVRRVKIGHLDPVGEPTGVLQRLQNLGYVSPRTRVDPNDAATLAGPLAAFQRAAALTVTGALDDDTRGALQKAHGC
jgi:hypothetical protein